MELNKTGFILTILAHQNSCIHLMANLIIGKDKVSVSYCKIILFLVQGSPFRGCTATSPPPPPKYLQHDAYEYGTKTIIIRKHLLAV